MRPFWWLIWVLEKRGHRYGLWLPETEVLEGHLYYMGSLGLNKLHRRKQRKGKEILRHCLNPQIHPFLKPEITMNFPNKWVRQFHFLDKIVWAAITTEKEIGKILNPNLCYSWTEAQRHRATPCHWMSYCARISLVKMLPWEVINN